MKSALLLLLLSFPFLTSCTIVRVDSAHGGPGVEVDGLVSGHAVGGWLANETPFRLSVLEGSQDGSVLEMVVWKLLRLEIGLAGASIGIGPLHFGLGVLAYEADSPHLERHEEDEDEDRDVEDDDDQDPDGDGW